MKRAAILGGAVGLVLLAFAAPASVAGTYHVHAIKTYVMSQPKRFAKKVGELHYKDSVQVVERKGEWYRVEYAGVAGWVPLQALTEGRWDPRAGRAEGADSVDRDSVQLAARGFTADIEQDYASSHPDLDFGVVDALEGTLPEPSQVLKFASEGGLSGVTP